MCCFFLALMFLGPRFGFLIYWFLAPVRINLAFESLNFPFLVGVAGLIFVPWTTLMWVAMFPMNGWDWLWIGFGLMADIASYVGTVHKRQDVPYYPANDPLKNI